MRSRKAVLGSRGAGVGALIACAALAVTLAVGCSGGGGGGAPRSGGSTGASIAGTAATGAALDGATVTVKDANGTTRTASAVTGADGTYTVDVTGLVAPFLVQVDDGATTLFSVGTEAGTVNVTPFTDLIIRTYYDAQGLDLDAVFSDPGAPDMVPTPGEVRTIAAVVERIIAPILAAAGIDPAAFDLITTPFTANGSGIDGILDDTSVNGQGEIHYDDGSTALASTVTASGGEIGAQTVVTTASGTATTSDSAVVATSTAAQTDLAIAEAGAAALFQRLADVIAAQGASLDAADIIAAGIFDADFLSGGADRDAEADEFADELAGGGVQLVRVERIVRFDRSNPSRPVVEVVATTRVTSGGRTVEVQNEAGGEGTLVIRKQTDGTWAFYGDQRPMRFEARNSTSTVHDSRNNPVDSVEKIVRIHVQGPENRFRSVTVTGLIPPNLSSNTVLPLALNPFGKRFQEDSFEANPILTATAFPAAGSVYTFALTATPSGAVSTFEQVIRGSTTETFDITHYTVLNSNGTQFIPRTDRATFAANNTAQTPANSGDFSTQNLLGKTIRVEWTRPTAIAIAEVEVTIFAQDASFRSSDQEDPLTPQDAVVEEVVIPATVTGGGPVKNASISVFYTANNGARLMAQERLKEVP